MRFLKFVLFVLLLLLGCTTPPERQTQLESGLTGLLRVTISGVSDGASPTAKAEWVGGRTGEVGRQSIGLVSSYPSFTRQGVQFYDHSENGSVVRYISSTFEIANNSSTPYNNLVLYAVNAPGNLGGTGIASITAANGTNLTDVNLARSFQPIHGMVPLGLNGSVVPNNADLHLLTPAEVSNLKSQFNPSTNGIPTTAEPLQYGFVARNYKTSGDKRAISGSPCVGSPSNPCGKGYVTLAYKFPRPVSSPASPYSFVLYFAVGNDTQSDTAQSLEEQSQETVAGYGFGIGIRALSEVSNQTIDPDAALEVRTLAQTSYSPPTVRRSMAGFLLSKDSLNPLCRVFTAGSLANPQVWLGPNPIPSASGSLDVCFGFSGRRSSGLSSDSTGQVNSEQAEAVALQPDGKIVVVGWDDTGTNRRFMVMRYLSNGALDKSFGGGGRVVESVASTDDRAQDMAIQPDGKIVVAGVVYGVSGADFGLMRLNPDGSLDPTFSGDGKTSLSFGSGGFDVGFAAALQGDGKIIVAGSTPNGFGADFAVARFNPDGSLDTGFDGDGKATVDFGGRVDTAHDLVVQNDGKIVLVGESSDANNVDFAVARLNPNGSVDSGFATGGKRLIAIAPGNGADIANGVTLQSDGKIVVVGASWNNLNYDFSLVRMTTAGGLDPTFDTDGIVTTAIANNWDGGYDLKVQTNGKIVVAGYTSDLSNADIAVLRYNPNGSLDTSFNGNGIVTTPIFTLDESASGLALQNDGKIVVVGSTLVTTTPSNDYDFALVRYNP